MVGQEKGHAVSAPITPNDFRDLIPGPTGSFCEKVVGGLLNRLSRLLYLLVSYMFKEDGTISDEFCADVASACEGVCNGDGTDPGTGTTLAAPINVSASDGLFSDRVRVTWSAVSGATSYDIYRATSSDSATSTVIGNPTTTSFDDTTVEVGTQYWYWVKAKNTTQVSALSSPDSGYATGMIAAPVGLDASQGFDALAEAVFQVRLVWQTVSGTNIFYDVYYSDEDDFSTAGDPVLENLAPYDNSESAFIFPPSGPSNTCHDGGNYIQTAVPIPSAERRKVLYFWVKAKQMSGSAVTAISPESSSATGWAVGDGSTQSPLSDATFSIGTASVTVPAGATRAWLVAFGSGGNGAGGGNLYGGGSGGGGTATYGLIDVVAGEQFTFVFGAAPTRAPRETNGTDGPDLTISYDGDVIATLDGGGGGVYDGGGGGGGGAGGEATVENGYDATIKVGRDGLEADGEEGARSGARHFEPRIAGAHFNDGNFSGDASGGAGGSWARSVPDLATGGISARGAGKIIWYT